MAKQKRKNTGKCVVCGKNFELSEIKKHIADECFFAKKSTQKEMLYLLEVRYAYDPVYWLMIAVSEHATLKDIDGFLRDTWLECCGHLSSFNINGEIYDACPDSDFGMENKSMKFRVKGILAKSVNFGYIYDFGSSTELTLGVIDAMPGKLEKSLKVQLLAANLFPESKCDGCKNVAAYACPCCEEKVCKKCADEHECGGPEDVLLPLTNSPRCGICGYTGGGILDSFK